MDRAKTGELEILRFLKKLKRQIKKEFEDARVIVVGSYARGEYIEGVSDVDIIIISKKFEGMNFLERLHKIAGIIEFPDFQIDLIPLSPEEFEKKKKNKLNTIHHMAKHAIEI